MNKTNVESVIKEGDIAEYHPAINLDDIEFLTSHQSVKKIQTCNLRQSGDRHACMLTGICDMPNGALIVADHYNARLIRIENTTQTVRVKDQCIMANKPWDVCAITSHEVAVTIPARRLIQSFHLKDTLVLTKSLKMPHDVRIIAYTDGELFVSGQDPVIHVYTTTGIPLRHFSTNPYTGETVTVPSHGMIVKSNTLFITYLEHGITAVDAQNGRLIWQFNGEEIKGSRGVCDDGKSGIFVCGNGVHNVVQFCESGKISGIVDYHGDIEQTPTGVCYTQNGKLTVTYDDGSIRLIQM